MVNKFCKKWLLGCCFILLTILLQAQCNVQVGTLKDGTKYVVSTREKLYEEKDYMFGVRCAFIRSMILQDKEQKKLIKFIINVMVGVKDKAMVTPRKLNIFFADGIIKSFQASSLDSPKKEGEIYIQESTFILTNDDLKKIQDYSISKVQIIDDREDTVLEAEPYQDLLKKQYVCLMRELNFD